MIPESHDLDASVREHDVAFQVALDVASAPMLVAVKFDREPNFRAVKIEDIPSDRLLPPESKMSELSVL